MNESDYERGSRQAWLSMLAECCLQLGYSDPEASKAGWIKERESTVAALRSLCEDFGDNDWPEDLSLADVVEKHLARHLHLIQP